MSHFITNINIKKVRHLQNIEILISKNEKKHLILTGKNGSGKTSVLKAITRYLESIENKDVRKVKNYSNELQRLEKELLKDPTDYDTIMEHKRLQDDYNYYCSELQLDIYDEANLENLYDQGEFILAYFDAKRNPSIEIPNSVPKIKLNTSYKITENIGNVFLKYLVYLKTQQSFARNENDEQVVQRIEKWFDNFENALKNLFEDESIKLIFEYKNLNFKISQNHREDYGFDVLSDGYSAVLDIVMNLILRMEDEKRNCYDLEGIVIIDEVETHLHIELQKKIMPFLTSFFPNIQFIVSTHSPFVLNSIDNSVIYDLEKNLRVENLSGYAYDGIVESYFDVDKYSNTIKEKMDKYEKLIKKETKTEDEILQVAKLRENFNTIPKDLAPELVYKFKGIELLRKAKSISKKNRGEGND